jgi:putative ABC transport system ATP-binding protein
MLEVKEVTKSFSSGDSAVTAVSGVTMAVADGEFVTIVGRSGSGKSTLMSLLGGLEQPTSGSIEVNGEDITRFSGRQLNGYRSHDVGFVFQSYNLVPNLTAAENVMLRWSSPDVASRNADFERVSSWTWSSSPGTSSRVSRANSAAASNSESPSPGRSRTRPS